MTTLEGNELRRAVAEALGYSIEYHKNNRNYIVILDPNKQKVYGPTNAEFTHLVFKWATDESAIPDYANDLNTIKDAPLPDNMVIDVRFQMPTATFPKWGVFIYLYGNTAADYREYLSGHPGTGYGILECMAYATKGGA